MEAFQKNTLFQGLTSEEIQACITASKAKIYQMEKGAVIFRQKAVPHALYMLLKGSVLICKSSAEGKRYIVGKIYAGDIFGEIFVFSEIPYDFYTVAQERIELLEIPSAFFRNQAFDMCSGYQRMMYNMLRILAGKAYRLNQRVQLLTGGTLRQKIAKMILEKAQHQSYVKLGMNREMMADFLHVARPSLSRELTHMQRDGLIELDQDTIKLLDAEGLHRLLNDM